MILFIIYLCEEISTFVTMIVKFPMRLVCIRKKDHDWRWKGGGFLFGNKYAFICKRCGCRSTGNMDDLEKKGFKGTVKIE
jgi:hypothetical protein